MYGVLRMAVAERGRVYVEVTPNYVGVLAQVIVIGIQTGQRSTRYRRSTAALQVA